MLKFGGRRAINRRDRRADRESARDLPPTVIKEMNECP
jgi:hypothetical protein